METASTPPAEVAQVFERYPDAARARLMDVRARVFAMADALDVGPLTETLKWGEPAYLTSASGAGSTIRLAWSPKAPEAAQVLFICTTKLVDRFRERHGGALDLVGDRAIHLPFAGDVAWEVLDDCLALALTHKRRKG